MCDIMISIVDADGMALSIDMAFIFERLTLKQPGHCFFKILI